MVTTNRGDRRESKRQLQLNDNLFCFCPICYLATVCWEYDHMKRQWWDLHVSVPAAPKWPLSVFFTILMTSVLRERKIWSSAVEDSIFSMSYHHSEFSRHCLSILGNQRKIGLTQIGFMQSYYCSVHLWLVLLFCFYFCIKMIHNSETLSQQKNVHHITLCQSSSSGQKV